MSENTAKSFRGLLFWLTMRTIDYNILQKFNARWVKHSLLVKDWTYYWGCSVPELPVHLDETWNNFRNCTASKHSFNFAAWLPFDFSRLRLLCKCAPHWLEGRLKHVVCYSWLIARAAGSAAAAAAATVVMVTVSLCLDSVQRDNARHAMQPWATISTPWVVFL